MFLISISCLAWISVSWLQGRFTIAAKHHMSIAEIYETELVDIDKVKKISVIVINISIKQYKTQAKTKGMEMTCQLYYSVPFWPPGHRSLWTSWRLLQRWRVHQVIICYKEHVHSILILLTFCFIFVGVYWDKFPFFPFIARQTSAFWK